MIHPRLCNAKPNFYPRSPCGERPPRGGSCYLDNIISIHALLAESDSEINTRGSKKMISIHALLAESDLFRQNYECFKWIFLSTLSLRRATMIHPRLCNAKPNFYPRSPCGERLEKVPADVYYQAFLSTLSLRRATTTTITICTVLRFLSTLSLRRATTWQRGSRVTYVISIHALLAESDANWFDLWGWAEYFYPRSPCGERPIKAYNIIKGKEISIHALLAESDLSKSSRG